MIRTLMREAIGCYFFDPEFIRPHSLCFDMGANIGDRTRMFRLLGASVIAVEPNLMCVRKLERRFRGDKRVKIMAQGVAASISEKVLRIADPPLVASMSDDWIVAVRERGGRGTRNRQFRSRH